MVYVPYLFIDLPLVDFNGKNIDSCTSPMGIRHGDQEMLPKKHEV